MVFNEWQKIIRIAGFGSILAIFAGSILAQDTSDEVIVIQGATIITGVSEQPQTGQALVIRGNIIEAIVAAQSPVPDGAKVIDMTGKYIIPGLIDSHVHWLDWMGELFINHGVTSIIALTNLDNDMRASSHQSATGPRLFHTGNRPQFTNTDTPEQIVNAIQNWLLNEPDMAHFNTYDASSRRAYRLAAEEVHRHGFLLFSHTENAPDSIRDGHDIVEHVWGFTQAVMTEAELRDFQAGEFLTWATFMTDRWEQLDKFIREAVNAGTYLNPTLVYEWGGMSKDAVQRELNEYRIMSDPRLVYYPKNIAESLLAKHRQIKNFSSRYENTPYVDLLPEQDQKQFEQGYANVNRFIRNYVNAGGKIQAGTDAVSGGMPGLGLHQEMEMLVEAGLTPMQAIKAATKWSAEVLEGKNGARGPAAVGSIEPGKLADLLVLSADPLDDISNTQKIERVMKNGKWLTQGYNPEYYTFTSPSRSIAGATLAPVISSATPSILVAGDPVTRVVLEGSGFMLTSLVRVNTISVKTRFINPRKIEIDLPASIISRATPNPYSAPGPYQNIGVVGYRSIEINVFNPPPEGGTSNSIHVLIQPR